MMYHNPKPFTESVLMLSPVFVELTKILSEDHKKSYQIFLSDSTIMRALTLMTNL